MEKKAADSLSEAIIDIVRVTQLKWLLWLPASAIFFPAREFFFSDGSSFNGVNFHQRKTAENTANNKQTINSSPPYKAARLSLPTLLLSERSKLCEEEGRRSVDRVTIPTHISIVTRVNVAVYRGANDL